MSGEAAQAVQVAHLWCRWVVFHQRGHFLMNYPFSATIRDLHRLHRCAGFPNSYTTDFFANHRVLWLLHPPVLLKLSHFPAVFTQAIIPSLIHILHIGSHTDGALQGWMDDCLYFSFLSRCPVPFHCTSGAACITGWKMLSLLKPTEE